MSKIIDNSQLVNEMKRLNREYGKVTKDVMLNNGKFSTFVYQDRFGSWNNALEECGIEKNVELGITEEDVLTDIMKVSEEITSKPSLSDMDVHGKYSRKIYAGKFKWTELLEKCGFEFDYRISKGKLLEEIKNLNDKVDGPPSISEMEQYGKYSKEPYERAFGTWSEAVTEAGFSVLNGPEKHKHPDWKGEDKEHRFGSGWYIQRRKCWERDDSKCKVCEKDVDDMGKRPHVHHIKPREEWDIELEYEDMNSLDNLICLCTSCHNKFEGKWKDSSPLKFKNNAREEL